MNEKLILVIDDSKFLCTMLQKAFDSVGYNTLVAYTLEEGLSLFEQSRPDLLLLDINLPDRPGPEACTEIKKNPQYNATSVILMSGSYEEYIKQQVSQCGADGYIRKPFSPGSILKWVKDNAALLFNDPGAGFTALPKTVEHVQKPSQALQEKAEPASCQPAPSNSTPLPQTPMKSFRTVDSTPVQKTAPLDSSNADSWGKDLSIIITDDSTFLCSILKDTLEKVGFKVNTFPNIRETGLYLRQNKADLLFLDINLPDISGNRACQIIKDSPITRDLPVVLISGAQEEQLARLTKESGANGFITKPFTPMTVLSWLKEHGRTLFPGRMSPEGSSSHESTNPVPDSAIRILIEQLSSATRAVKLAACYSLGEYKAVESVDKLLELLYDSDPEIQGEAIWALGEIRVSSALVPILRVLGEDNVWLKGRAVEALGKLGDPIVIDELASLFKYHNHDLKIAIIKALGAIGTDKSRNLLTRWALHADKDIAANARIMLNIMDKKLN